MSEVHITECEDCRVKYTSVQLFAFKQTKQRACFIHTDVNKMQPRLVPNTTFQIFEIYMVLSS